MLQIDLIDRCLNKPLRKNSRNGDRAGAHFECSGAELEQQRRHQQEVVLAQQDNLDVVPASEQFVQTPRGLDPRESAADHKYSRD